jgi:hypothetical protein
MRELKERGFLEDDEGEKNIINGDEVKEDKGKTEDQTGENVDGVGEVLHRGSAADLEGGIAGEAGISSPAIEGHVLTRWFSWAGEKVERR